MLAATLSRQPWSAERLNKPNNPTEFSLPHEGEGTALQHLALRVARCVQKTEIVHAKASQVGPLSRQTWRAGGWGGGGFLSALPTKSASLPIRENGITYQLTQPQKPGLIKEPRARCSAPSPHPLPHEGEGTALQRFGLSVARCVQKTEIVHAKASRVGPLSRQTWRAGGWGGGGFLSALPTKSASLLVWENRITYQLTQYQKPGFIKEPRARCSAPSPHPLPHESEGEGIGFQHLALNPLALGATTF